MTKSEFSIIERLIDIPQYKLVYALNTGFLTNDIIKDYFFRYNILYTKELHNSVVRYIEIKLEGNSEVEREWSTNEYNNLVKWE